MTERRNLAGILCLAVGVMIFSTQDAIIKALSGHYAVTQAIFFRCIVALPMIFAFVHVDCGLGRLKSRNLGPMLLRGVILLGSYTSYYMALAALPMAEAIALFFTAPLIVTLLAAPMLGEPVTAKTWIAAAAGFIGTLVIVRPGTSLFEPAGLLSLIAASAYAIPMIQARKLGATEPATVMSFYTSATYLVGSGLFAALLQALHVTGAPHPSIDFLLRPWAWPTARDAFLMGLCGFIAAIAMTLITQAYKMAEARLVTVFEYTGMIWSPLWGFLFFAEVPRWTTFAGMALIVGAGVYAIWAAAERRR
jgi:drug/metabolite transporter (DMT)-like permease